MLPPTEVPRQYRDRLHDLLSHLPVVAIWRLACLATLPPQDLTAYIEATYSDGGKS